MSLSCVFQKGCLDGPLNDNDSEVSYVILSFFRFRRLLMASRGRVSIRVGTDFVYTLFPPRLLTNEAQQLAWLTGTDGPLGWPESDMVFNSWQIERCPNTLRLHAQGFLIVSETIGLRVLKDVFDSSAHWENRYGTRSQAQAYTRKEESRFEHGYQGEFGRIPPGVKGKRNDMKQIRLLIELGASEVQIADRYFSQWARGSKAMNEYRQLKRRARNPDEDVNCIAIYGPPGTGKSLFALRLLAPKLDGTPRYFRKTSTNWWDQYDGEDLVVIDEFFPAGEAGRALTYGTFKSALDRYPLSVEGKTQYGGAKLTARTFIVTSNLHPSRWYPESDYGEVRRRFKHIYYAPTFDGDFEEEIVGVTSRVPVTRVAARAECMRFLTEEAPVNARLERLLALKPLDPISEVFPGYESPESE